MANKYLNTFSTQADYEEYIAGDVDHYPNIAYIESTSSVMILDEEPEPVFSLMVTDQWGTEYSDGDTIEGDGEQQDFLYVYGYLDGQQISSDDFSVAANNDLVFSDGTRYYQAALPYGYDNTYNYTITATCGEQTVTFSLTYAQPESPAQQDIELVVFDDSFSQVDTDLAPISQSDAYYVKLHDGENYLSISNWSIRVLDQETYEDAVGTEINDGSNDGFSDSYRIDFWADGDAFIIAAYTGDPYSTPSVSELYVSTN